MSTAAARAAIVAAQNRHRWGLYASAMYAYNRGASVALVVEAYCFELRRGRP